jgi:SAM-dependent methyltransferase
MNREAYNKISNQWDSARRKFYGREREYLDVLLSALAGDATVIDLGCGTGRPMAEEVISRGYRVIGIDQSSEQIKKAAERFPEQRWVLSSIETYEFNDGFDAAIIWDSLFHIERSYHEPILRKVVERLPSGGRVMLTVGGSEHPAFTDVMFGQEFFYDSNSPEKTLNIIKNLGCHPLIGEFMNLPTEGRDKGRYAIIAEKA